MLTNWRIAYILRGSSQMRTNRTRARVKGFPSKKSAGRAGK